MKFLLLLLSITAHAQSTNNFKINNNLTMSGNTASRACYLDASKNLKSSTVTDTELAFLSGATSSIQTQLNAKQSLDAQLTDLAGLSYTGNALKVVRVNAGETAWELATVSGGSGSPGGSSTQVQYNAAGSFGGISGATSNGTTLTLVAPILGTPASVTLTNGTGLPISTGVSGLGSGIATWLATPSSANLAAALTDESGSGAACFVVSPSFTTPSLGVATATSINGVSISGGSSPALTVTGTSSISGSNTGDQTSVTGNAGTVTFSDAASDTTTFVALGTSATGSLAPATDAGLSYNASTNVLTSSGGFVGSLTGNASTATALQTGRTINGTTFDGTGNITVTAAAGTLTGSTLNSGVTASSLTSTGTVTSGTWSGLFGAVTGANLTNLTAANISAGTAGIDISGNSATTNGLKSATTTVNVSSATAPTAGQALIATSSTAATWQSLGGGGDALTSGTLAQFAATTSSQLAGVISDETGTAGSLVFSNSPTLVTPNLGTPSTLVGTNITGTASGLTAGNVTTNANITGAITSVGNASSLGSFSSANLSGALTDESGSGAACFVNSPTLITPNLGTPSTLVGTNITGTATGLTSGITNALKSATTTVDVSAATAPTNGQVLTATSSTTATWQTPSGGGSSTTQTLAYSAKTSNYTITTSDFLIDCTSGTFTVTLPTAVGITGQSFYVKNSGTGIITVATTSSQTIDGFTNQVIPTQYSGIKVMSNGSNWIIVEG